MSNERNFGKPALKPARINLAILTYNALDYTKMCLESIARNTRVEHNVFVLDNGSTDGSREWLRQHTAQNFYSEEAVKNGGVPGGRNRLIEIITPMLPEDGFVVFCDNDMELKEGWDSQYLSFFEDHPEAGIASAFGHRMIVRQFHRELLPPPAYTAPVDVACGGFACWVRAKALKAIGGFDENLGLFWHEDDDFSLRAIAAGWDVYALPHVNVVHHEHKSGVANPGIKSGGSPKNQIYLCEKWRSLGLVDAEGRINRHVVSKDVVTETQALNLGGFQWLRPETTLQIPVNKTAASGNSYTFSLSCAKKEFYDTFPFSVEVSSVVGSVRLTFSDSDETHEISLPAQAGSKIKILSSSSFVPALNGLGAHCRGALALRFQVSPNDSAVLTPKSEVRVANSLAWFSSIFDTDRYAELSQAIFPALLQRLPDLSFRCLGLNESIVSDLRKESSGLKSWEKAFKNDSAPRTCVVAADPLTADGQNRYLSIRKNNPSVDKLVAFVLLENTTLSPAWIAAANTADDVWVLSERERAVLTAWGMAENKVSIVPVGVTDDFLPQSNQDLPLALIDGRICFLAQVHSVDDPFLQSCVRAITSAFSKDDGVALLVSIAPSGAQLPPDYIKSILGDPDFRAEDRAPIFTISPYSSPALRSKIFQSVHCLLTASPVPRRLELLEAFASGLPVLHLDSDSGILKRMVSPNAKALLDLGISSGSKVANLGPQAIASFVAELRAIRTDLVALRSSARQAAWAERDILGPEQRLRFIVEKLSRPSEVIPSAREIKSETIIREISSTLRIGIDARTLTYAETRERGIGHYTINHLAEIFRQRPEWEFILYVNEGESSDALEALLKNSNVHLGRMGTQHSDGLDLYHIADPMTILPGFDSPFLCAPAVPSTAVFYDLIPLVKRDMHFDCWEAWTKKCYVRRLAELKSSSAVVLPISEASRQDLYRLAGFPLERAVTIMAGINRGNINDKPSTAAMQQVKEKFGLHSPFFLSVGGLDGHKGFMATAQAYAALRSTRTIQFAAVGSLKDPYKESYRKLFEANNIPGVVFPGYVSREEMTCLYAMASGLVFPSHYEGFGFPVLEAMAFGCPVVTTNVSSLPEVVGEAGILVGVDDAKGIENAMRRLLDEADLRAQLAKRGLEQAKKFSWDRTAQKTIEVWQKLVGEQSETSAQNHYYGPSVLS